MERSIGVLRKGGTLVSILEPLSRIKGLLKGKKAHFVFVQPNAEDLEEIAALIDDGEIKPVVENVFSLSEAHKAHDLIQSGHTRGKIVLKVRE
jgi:NADPH:quinone reductase-like Zn-dependent oxidoreductase